MIQIKWEIHNSHKMRSLAFGGDASASLDARQLLNESMDDSESEHLGLLMDDDQPEQEDDVPALQDRIAGMFVDQYITGENK